MSEMDWIRSPLDVPIPTQREASPRLLLGTSGRTSVAVDSRMKVESETGPVEKAGPMAALTDAAAAAMAETVWRVEGILIGVWKVWWCYCRQ